MYSDLKCSGCRNRLDFKSISVCPNCGSLICQSCDAVGGGTCPGCYSYLNKLS